MSKEPLAVPLSADARARSTRSRSLRPVWLPWAVALSVLIAGAVGCTTGKSDPSGSDKNPPAPAPPAPTPPEPPEPPPPVLSPAELQKLAIGAEEALQDGHEERARTDLQRVLDAEPGHRLAQVLMKQIQEAPESIYGRETASYALRANDSLSRLAQRCFGDVHMFYVIARYNKIEVPSRVAQGQVIRVPARCATPQPPAPPAPQPAPPPPAPVPAPAPPVPAPVPTPPSGPGRVNKEADAALRSEIAKATRAARTATARQDLREALKQWNRVLDLDPNNEVAKYERARTLDRIERVEELERQKKR
ncbi:MAG TPA: hypothetical protein PKE61_13600 [Burkholderiaceae bacterium]|nr:hypothetical protein [Burkholderiaceae bacterium]HNB45756.1 hypothetical protein [Burkholderiaceae bacterium]HNG78011.1 hypothetical protein [Burkholderiaceae bacterium]